MVDSRLFYTLHPVSRSLLGLALLSLATATHSLTYGLLLISVSATLLRAVENSWSRVRRSFGLLRWFVIPILVLHLFFSPGELIFPGWPLPLTWEGLQLGVTLSVHLVAIFFAALVLFLSLSRSEWLALLLSLPSVGRGLITYLILISPLRNSVSELLQALKLQWQQRRSWMQLPHMLVSAFSSVLAVAAEQSQQIWLRWPASKSMLAGPENSTSVLSQGASLACLVIALLGVGVAWQM